MQFIIDEIRDKKSTQGRMKRIDLIERRDIHNIIRDHNIHRYLCILLKLFSVYFIICEKTMDVNT